MELKAKGTRRMTITVDVTVDVDEVTYTNMDEWSDLYHDREWRKATLTRMSGLIRRSVGEAILSSSVKIDPSVHVEIVTDEKNSKITNLMRITRDQQESERRGLMTMVENELGMIGSPVTLSLSKEEEDSLIANHKFLNPTKFMLTYRGWDDEVDLNSPIMDGVSNFRDVVKQAVMLVERSNDKHHIFLEGIRPRGQCLVDGKAIAIFEVVTGS